MACKRSRVQFPSAPPFSFCPHRCDRGEWKQSGVVVNILMYGLCVSRHSSLILVGLSLIFVSSCGGMSTANESILPSATTTIAASTTTLDPCSNPKISIGIPDVSSGVDLVGECAANSPVQLDSATCSEVPTSSAGSKLECYLRFRITGRIPDLFTNKGNFRWNMSIEIVDSQGFLADEGYGCGLVEEIDDGMTFRQEFSSDRPSYGEIRVSSLVFNSYIAERECY